MTRIKSMLPIAASLALVAVVIVLYYSRNSTPVPAHVVDTTAVEAYVRDNINVISPQPPVLGGTFYVTNVSITGTKTGVVSYEDGHIALVADFVFEARPDGSIQIPAIRVRTEDENRPAAKNAAPAPMITKPDGTVCRDLCGNTTCEAVVCEAEGCPCAETQESCPADCL